MSSSVAMDALFGPQLPGQFDFTLFFEHAMLWLVPGGLLVLVTPLYIRKLLRGQRQVRPGILLPIKLTCGLALVAMQAGNIALWHKTDYFRSDITVSASAMSLIASLCTVAIICIAHSYSLQPSTFLSVFCSITLLFDITMARSYFRRSALGAIAALQVCVVALKLLLIILEEVPKRSLFVSFHRQSTVSVEHASGFWNRFLFIWINPLLVFGWRNTLTAETLPDIGDEFSSENLLGLFLPHWAKVPKSSKLALLVALARTLRWPLLKVLAPRLCFVCLLVVQPLFLQSVISAVSRGMIETRISDSLIGAGALLYLGLSTSRTLYAHWEYRAVTFARGILISALYDKMQRLRIEDLEASAAVTLMSTDVDGTETLISLAYDTLSCIVQLSLGICLLYRFVGAASFLIFVPTLLTFVGSFITGNVVTKARAATNAETQKRVAATSNLLAQLRSIKCMGLSEPLSAYIEKMREDEVNVAMRERYTVLWIFAFGAINYTVSPAIVFAGAYFWTRAENPMSVPEVFAILAVLGVCCGPLIDLFRSVTQWAACFVSIGRIYEYLVHAELQDPRDVPGQAYPGTTDDELASQSNPKPFAFQLHNVSVTSPSTGPVLKEVCLTIPWGSLSMMWGPINSGKSTLLKVLLGEVVLNSGTVSAGSSTIAYCGQEPWIPNDTIRRIVVGANEHVEARYRAVLHACTLDDDLQELPDGDRTRTGSGGCNLSGGQRQRLSIARAVYAQQGIMVLDDIFSSVDPETARLIFDRLFGSNGLVRQWNCAVIMTTNRLELLDFADQIYLFTNEGWVMPQHPNSASGALDSNQSSDEEEDNDDSFLSNRTQAGRAFRDTKDAEPPQVKAKEIIGEPDVDAKTADLSLYSFFLGPAGMPAIISWVVFVMISAVGEWSPVLFLRVWYPKLPHDKSYFAIYVSLAILCVLLNVSSGAFYFIFIFKKITKDIHRKLLRVTMGATPQYQNETDSGTLLNRFGQDISLITRRLALLVNQFLFIFFQTLVEMVIIASGSGYVVPAMLFIVAALGVIQYFYLRSSRQLRQLELEASATLFTQFTETSDGIHHIRGFGWQKKFRAELFIALNRSQQPRYLLYCIQRWLTLTMDLTGCAASLILIAIATKVPGATTDAALGLAMLSLITFGDTTTIFIQTWTTFETALGAVRRIKVFVKSTPQEEDVDADPSLLDNWPSVGEIDFNALTATYKTKEGAENRAINNLTVTIHGGQKVGLMGRTGSGKSTMLAAILRMVDCKGSISIDGLDIRTVPREILRSRITTITQDGLRLKASLRFNLYPFAGECPSDDEMVTALRDVDIWNHVQLNGGLDVDYSKLKFSAGQKQLMFLARGILHQRKTRNKIVLIDEVTSSMTLDAEPELQRLIDYCFVGCTILMVSHRLESFPSADAISGFRAGGLERVFRRRSNGAMAQAAQ